MKIIKQISANEFHVVKNYPDILGKRWHNVLGWYPGNLYVIAGDNRLEDI